MASSMQQVHDEKEKAHVAEALKEAKSFLNNNNANIAGQYQLARVAGVMNNQQPRNLDLFDSHSFKGEFSVKPPTGLRPFGTGMFSHKGAFAQGCLPVVVGSKGAVKYTHIDKLPNPQLGYVLAWENPDQENGIKKVYVTVGDIKTIMDMEWSEIEQNLNASISESRYPKFGFPPLAYARIEDLGDKLAAVGASFYDKEYHN